MSKLIFSFVIVALLFVGGYFFKEHRSNADSTQVVNVYSSRKEDLLKVIFQKFTKKTGIQVNYITDSANQLIARMENEGTAGAADVFLTADVANLSIAKDKGLLIKTDSHLLKKVIPEKFRDKDDYWFGLTKRVRLIVYNKKAVADPSLLSNYEDLAASKWQGKFLVSSSSSPYNQSLLAFIIANDGEDKARNWVKGLVQNMARKPSGGDTDQLRAVAAGEADVTVVNSYYFARTLVSEHSEDKKIAESLAMIFPNQDNYGAMINISGGAVTASSKNKDNAVSLLEFLASNEAQKLYAQVNQEYPVVSEIEVSEVLNSWGQFKESALPIENLVKYLDRAVLIADEERWR